MLTIRKNQLNSLLRVRSYQMCILISFCDFGGTKQDICRISIVVFLIIDRFAAEKSEIFL